MPSHFRRWSLFLMIGIAAMLAGAGLIWRGLFYDLPTPSRNDTRTETQSILFTDRNGWQLFEAIDPHGSKYIPLPLEEIPLACRQATVATEDAHFYSHPGVDPLAIARAAAGDAWHILRNGEARLPFSGASTLTQQLARNLYLSTAERHERTLRRKLREAWLAWRLEKVYTKDELLALYLNTTYFGHFAVGIEAAARSYFGVGARDLDLAQCALLAGLPQNPAGYNPIENLDAARERQTTVLRLMVDSQVISRQQADEASQEALALASVPFPIEAPHFVMWAQSQLEELIPAPKLRQGGLRVVTTLDLDRQHAAEAIIRRRLQQLQPCRAGAAPPHCDARADPARRVDNAALIALDPHGGAVLAMVGSPDYFDPRISGALNATLSPRQPGSSIKPLTYAAAFDPLRARLAGGRPWTAATLVADLRTAFPTAEGRPYVPQNYDLREHGPVTVRTALANSYNIPAVKALQSIGVEALLEQAQALGIPWRTQRTPATDAPDAELGEAANGYGLALTLGGAEVRLLDLAAAYAAFANGGKRPAPHAIERVETLDGQILYDAASDPALTAAPALDPRVAFLITDILSDATARLPAFGPGNVLELDRPAAAKTGTTTDWRDNWTLGYTPELVAGVWVGNADNAPMRDVSGISGAGPIWHDFMLAALDGVPVAGFAIPDGLSRIEICADSGLLPGNPSAASVRGVSDSSEGADTVIACPQRRPEWFIMGSEPTQVDRSHVQVAIDARTGQRATSDTPPADIVTETFWALPLEFQAWARVNGILQPPAATLAPLLARTSAPAGGIEPAGERQPPGATSSPDNRLVIVSPDPNRVYQLDPALPAAVQETPVTVRVQTALGGPVTLLVDGREQEAVGSPDYTLWWPLQKGVHTFEARARLPDGSPISSGTLTIRVEP